MENGQKRLKELFDGRKIFIVPDYQRAYAWEKSRQLPDFLEDIENQSMDNDYFLGTILFQEQTEKESGFDLIDVVDGQQRITTIIIFMKVLLSLLREKMNLEEFERLGLDIVEETYISYKSRPKLKAISPDDEFFQSYILGNRNGIDYIETPSQRKLQEAKLYFHEKLQNLTTDHLLSLKTKLDEKSKVITYSVKDSAEAALIFETTNDRGKSLTDLEKIKSFLMHKSCLVAGEDSDTKLSLLQQRFSEIFRDVESFEGKLTEDKVLVYHFIAFEKWTDKKDYQRPVEFIKNKINGLIKENKEQAASRFIEDFSLRIRQSFRIMEKLIKCKLKEYLDLQSLGRMGGIFPLLMAVYKHDGASGSEPFKNICRLLEVFSFRVLAMENTRSDAGQAAFYILAREFNGNFENLYDGIKEEIKKFSSPKKFEERLSDPEIYKKAQKGDLTYLLWKYENFLRTTEQPICPEMSIEELGCTDTKKRLTIEHIASQSQGKVIEDAEILDISGTELQANIHRLGNLTFDPMSANASKGNSAIEIKNSRYFSKAPYKTQNELEKFLDNGKWNIHSIEKRERVIIDFCLKKWNPDRIV